MLLLLLLLVQRRLGMWVYSLIVVSIVVFGMVWSDSCSRYLLQYYGLPPLEVSGLRPGLGGQWSYCSGFMVGKCGQMQW